MTMSDNQELANELNKIADEYQMDLRNPSRVAVFRAAAAALANKDS